MDDPHLFSQYNNPLLSCIKTIYQKYRTLLYWNAENESIIDVGVGDGGVAKEVVMPLVPNKISEYVGADISEKNLDYARENIAHPKFKVTVLDITTSNLPKEFKNRFNHVFANCLFHWIPEPRQALINIYNMLQDKGQLYFIAFEEKPVDAAFVSLDEGKWAKFNHKTVLSPFYGSTDPKGEYYKMLKSIGFSNIHIYEDSFTVEFTEEGYNGMIKAVNIFLSGVSEQERSEYVADYIRAMRTAKHSNHSNHVSFKYITGIATKLE